MKKISAFEYAINEAIDRSDLNENCEPRTQEEERELIKKDLTEQLSKMRNATTGEPLLPEPPINSIGEDDEFPSNKM